MDDTTGQLLELIRSGQAVSRAQLTLQTGLARATVASRLQLLLDSGLVIRDNLVRDTGGRPAERLVINPARGYLLGADIGGSHTRIALLDLRGEVLATSDTVRDINDGPEIVLTEVCGGLEDLATNAHVPMTSVFGAAFGLPGPVEQIHGRISGAPTMHGWDGFPVIDFVQDRLGTPVAIDKDSNIMALGEYHALESPDRDLIVLKVGMGVGAGIITDGRIFRGSHGAAGDLGHLPRRGGAPCRCGQEGCAEATAGGWSIARRLREMGLSDVTTSQDIVRLANARDPATSGLLRQAGNRLGEVLCDAIGILNPSMVIVGGNLAVSDVLLAGIRERVYEDAHPLATMALRIERGRLGDAAGLNGAGQLAAGVAFTGPRVQQLLST
ncbi:ROK family protein [Microbacterium sp. YY-01]|uniref:ROK family transcriptional regulator n=1 Tax=Microbacterium sp. YY-01 TaxID=3421634 RepID=UPI003D17F795